jgi:hypothetical protein
VSAQGESRNKSGAYMVSVNEVGPNVFDELTACAQCAGQTPRVACVEIEISPQNLNASLAIAGRKAFGIGRQRNRDLDAKRAQNSHLFVGPFRPYNGFDNV